MSDEEAAEAAATAKREPKRDALTHHSSPASTRRQALFALTATGVSLLSETSTALSRPPYGGTLQLSLPVDTAAIDPHDPFGLAAALVGASLFETIYQTHPTGAVYPTLAAGLPEVRNRTVLVDLRRGLRSAQGSPLDAPAVASSLRRSQDRHPALRALGRIEAEAHRIKLETTLPASSVATLLTTWPSAIVPKGFHPALPDCTGALASAGRGVSRLSRNPRAPRGGSYLREVHLSSKDLRACLRDFERGQSHVGLLGSGLYQAGKADAQFSLHSIGVVVLLAGSGLGKFGAPGVLAEELSRCPPQGFQALGLRSLLPSSPGEYRGPAMKLGVNAAEPWLVAIAGELARVWSRSRAPVIPQPQAAAELEAARRTGHYDAQLLFLRRDEPAVLNARLFLLDGTPAPRNTLKSDLAWTARRLRLGLLGRLEAYGAATPGIVSLSSEGRFALENAYFEHSFD